MTDDQERTVDLDFEELVAAFSRAVKTAESGREEVFNNWRSHAELDLGRKFTDGEVRAWQQIFSTGFRLGLFELKNELAKVLVLLGWTDDEEKSVE